jgi:hypothetical protein
MTSSNSAGSGAGKQRTIRRPLAAAAGMLLLFSGLAASPALASHPEVSLPGSNFEIDTDANLRVDDPSPSIDWANVTETRQSDKPTGAQDDSFGNGTKEDTAVPTVVDGSIPPNKSDLLTFGVYLEKVGTDRFLHLFWHRVQEPTGTTNMDFEFNQSKILSANGVTPVRTAGDLLVQYDLSQGGVNPVLFVSRWVTSGAGSQCQASNSTPCWGTKADLTAAGDATGSINTSPIPAAESDGLTTGTISPRTFGEASLNFNALVGTNPCVGFGSAYLKSRSSDAFTAALKDFIAPKTINVNDCGALLITKTRKHAADGPGSHPQSGVTFTVRNSANTIVGSGVTDANGQFCVSNLPFGTYSATETVPTGYVADGLTTKTASVSVVSTCGDGNEAKLSFGNTPLSNITVSFTSQVNGGTAAQISCTGLAATPPDGTPNAFDDTSESFQNLVPGTYTCTVVIDP